MSKIIKLGDVINLQNGYAFKSKEYSSDGYFVMRITNVQKGYISNHNPRYFKIKSPTNLEKFILKDKDILISLTGDVGRVGMIKKKHLPCILNQRVAKVDIIDESIINKNFLFLFLNSDLFIKEVEKNSHGTAQSNVATKDILNINLKLPPLKEQQRIVAKLDAVFAEINKVITIKKSTEKNIEKLKSSILNNLLNNNFLNTKIGDICELIYGKGLPKEKRVNENGIPAYGANGIKCYASEPLYNRPSIIIGRKGSAGELQWVDNPFWALDVTYYVLPNEKKVNLKFLYYLLQMQNLPKLAKGVKPGINRNEVYNIDIKLPTIDEQINITDRLEKIFKQQKILKELNDRINVNYHSLKLAIISKEIKNKAA